MEPINFQIKNEFELEEELEENQLNLTIREKEAFEEGMFQVKNFGLKRDEDDYEKLIELGVDEVEAAHVINRISEKRLKHNNL